MLRGHDHIRGTVQEVLWVPLAEEATLEMEKLSGTLCSELCAECAFPFSEAGVAGPLEASPMGREMTVTEHPLLPPSDHSEPDLSDVAGIASVGFRD